MLALVSLLAVSCSNDDIEITTYALKNDVKINVATTSAYESFGIDDYKNALAKYDDSYVGIMSLVYDVDGKLVAEENSYAKTIQQVQQKFALPNGTYTLVSFVTFVEKDGDKYESPYWKFAEKNDLSTVRVEKTDYIIPWWASIALATETIVVNDGNVTTNVTSLPVGSLLTVGYENFDKSSYTWFGYEFKQSSDGLYLDPSLTGVDKYYYENGYNMSNYWTAQYYSYEEDGLSEDFADVFILNEGRLNYCFGLSEYNGSGDISFTPYPSRDEYYTFRNGEYNLAYCYYVGGDKVCETYMGDGSDFSEWYDNVTKGNSDPDPVPEFKFVEPATDWGASVRYVQAYMSGYEMFMGSNGSAEYLSDGSYVIGYDGKYSESTIEYYFSSETTGLYEADLYYDAKVVSESQLLEALSEKYIYFGDDYGYHMFFNDDMTTGIMMYQDEEKTTWYVCYISLADLSGDVKAAKRAMAAKKSIKLPAKRTSKKAVSPYMRLRK